MRGEARKDAMIAKYLNILLNLIEIDEIVLFVSMIEFYLIVNGERYEGIYLQC